MVLIQGPGAIGRLLAARFQRAGVPVELLGRGSPADLSLSLIENGQISHRGVVRRRALGLPGATLARAWIIVTKAYDVRDAITSGMSHVTPDAPILVLSNGLGHDESLRELAGARPTLLGTIACGARAEGTDAVHALGEGSVLIGPPSGGSTRSGEDAAANALGSLFQLAGFVTDVVPDGCFAQWSKAALNCGLNPVAALLGVPNGAVPRTPYFRWAIEAARETAGLARATGLELPEHGWCERLRALCDATAPNRCSMLQDLEAGRRLEIDHLNGWVARRARRLHVSAPRNRRLAEVLSSEHAQLLLKLQRFVREGVPEAQY